MRIQYTGRNGSSVVVPATERKNWLTGEQANVDDAIALDLIDSRAFVAVNPGDEVLNPEEQAEADAKAKAEADAKAKAEADAKAAETAEEAEETAETEEPAAKVEPAPVAFEL